MCSAVLKQTLTLALLPRPAPTGIVDRSVINASVVFWGAEGEEKVEEGSGRDYMNPALLFEKNWGDQVYMRLNSGQ